LFSDVEAVSFDLWFTLIWEDDVAARGYVERRINVLEKYFSRYVDVEREELSRYYKLTDHIRMITPIPQLIKYFSFMLGVKLDDSIIELIAREYVDATLSFKPHVSDGAVEALEDLKSKGYRIGILTNTSFDEVGVRALLRNAGLDKYVDVVVSSCDIGFVKPSPEAFKRLADSLNVHINELVHVGDTYLDDVVGALNIGAGAILYTGLWNYYELYGPYKDRPRDIIRVNVPVIDDLRELNGLLR